MTRLTERYTDAETRIVALCRKEHGAFADTFNTAIDACQTVILDMYDNAPKDVIAVVRCRECKHYNAGFECLAEGYGIERDPDWFCADGEREVQE